jgi:hypothetical protein
VVSEIQWRWVLDRRPGISKALNIDEVAMARFKGWAETLLEKWEKLDEQRIADWEEEDFKRDRRGGAV